MITKHIFKNTFKLICGAILLLHSPFAQSQLAIDGVSVICKGEVAFYTLHNALPNEVYSWSVSPNDAGTISNYSNNQVAIQWNKSSNFGFFTLTAEVLNSSTAVNLNVMVIETFVPYITYDNEVGCQYLQGEDENSGNYMINNAQGCISVCEESEVEYTVHGTLFQSFSWSNFFWEITGGEIIKANGITIYPPVTSLNTGFYYSSFTDIVVKWGSVGKGIIKVTETTIHASPMPPATPQFCTPKSNLVCVDIIERPQANFLFDDLTNPPDGCYNICLNQTVYFKDLSQGSVDAPIMFYQWDFGDGSPFSHIQHPYHTYTQAGEYYVELLVINRCGCTDIWKQKICVSDHPVVEIVCPGVVCENDIAVYSANANCTTYDWKVSGGTIVNSSGNEVEVRWNQAGNDGFGFLSIDGSYCDEACPEMSKVRIPIVKHKSDIEGPLVICIDEYYRYTMPQWPATDFSWEIVQNTASAILLNQVTNDNFNELKASSPGTFVLTCVYENTLLYPACNGTANAITVEVKDKPEIIAPEKHCVNLDLVCSMSATITITGQHNWVIVKPDGTVVNQSSTGNGQVTFAASIFDINGDYVIGVGSHTGLYCEPNNVRINVLPRPPKPLNVLGADQVCISYPYDYGVNGLNGTVNYWQVTGGNIYGYSNPSTPPHGNSAVIIWNTAGSGTKSIEVYRESEEVPGCISDELYFVVNDIDLTGSITTTSTGFYEDNSDVFEFVFNNPSISSEGYKWALVPAGIGNITDGQGSNVCTVTWQHIASPSNVTLECEITKCGITQKQYFPLLVEKGTQITSLTALPSTTVCSGEEIVFTVTTTGAPAQEFLWDFCYGASGVSYPMPGPTSAQSEITHIFTNLGTTNQVCTVNVVAISSNTQLQSSSSSIVITIVPQPNVNLVPPEAYYYTVPFSPCTLTAAGFNSSFHNAQWYHQPKGSGTGSLIPGATSSTYIVTSAGDGLYWCQVTDINTGCVTITNKKLIDESGTGGGSACIPASPYGITGFNASIYASSPCNELRIACTTQGIVGQNIVNYTWTVDADASLYSFSGSYDKDNSPFILFHKAGMYTVTLVVEYTNSVSGAPNCFWSESYTVIIPYVPEMKWDFSCNGNNSYNLNLNDNSTSYPTYPITSWTWKQNGNTVSTSPHYTITGLTPGSTHTIELIISDGLNNPCTTSTVISIPTLPSAGYTVITTYPNNPSNPYKSCEEREISFIPDQYLNIIGFHWDFNDLGYSKMMYPKKCYYINTTNHTFQTSLTVTDKHGCTATAGRNIQVWNNAIVKAQPFYSPILSEACPGAIVSGIVPVFSDPIGTIHTYQWYHEDELLANCTTGVYAGIPSSSGGYWARVTNEHNCQRDINPPPALIVIKDAPTANINGKQEYCEGEKIVLKAITGNPAVQGGNYSWLAYKNFGGTYSQVGTYSGQTITITNGLLAGDYYFQLQIVYQTCTITSQAYYVLVHPVPQKPAIDIQPQDCDRYEIELSSATAYSSPVTYNWSTGANLSSTVVYNGGAYRLWVTDDNGCRSYEDVEIAYPPDFYFWRWPTGCYAFCPEYLPRKVNPSLWVYGGLNGSGFFHDWNYKIDGSILPVNGPSGDPCPHPCQPTSQPVPPGDIPCSLWVDLLPAAGYGNGPGDYTHYLHNPYCGQESGIMRIDINTCCEIDVAIVRLMCIQTTPNGNIYSFELNVSAVPCTASYIIKAYDNNGMLMAIDYNLLTPASLNAGSNTVQGQFLSNTLSTAVMFYIEVLCDPRCFKFTDFDILPTNCPVPRLAPPQVFPPENITNVNELNIFPNPANSTTTVYYSFSENEHGGSSRQIVLLDATGRPLNSINLTENSGTYILDLKGYAPGIYFIELWQNNRRLLTRKLLMQR